MAVFSRSRTLALVVIFGATVVAAVFAEASGLFGERLTQAYMFDTRTPGENVMGRLATWRMYMTQSSVSNYLVGQGAAAGVAKFGMESHNAYISLLTVYGVGGALWAVVSLAGFVRRAKSALRSADPVLSAVAAGCMWTLLLWGIYACTADAISSSYTRYLLFYLFVLVDRAHALVGRERGAETEAVVRPYGAAPASSAHAGFQVRR